MLLLLSALVTPIASYRPSWGFVLSNGDFTASVEINTAGGLTGVPYTIRFITPYAVRPVVTASAHDHQR